MSKGSIQITSKISGEGHGVYVLNMKGIVTALRKRLVESIVDHKYGSLSARIFRLLMLKKQLEQKQIANFAMLPMKDTRERLYKMFKDNYVQLQEVPKTVDHSPLRTFYLWHVDFEQLCSLICSQMYKSIRNIKTRLGFHLGQSKDIIARAEDAQIRQDNLTQTEKSLLRKVQAVEDQLEHSIISVDECLLIMGG